MKRICIGITILLLLTTGCKNNSVTEHQKFRTIIKIKTTPVKNQGNSSFCWAYAMLATIESEHLMMGDSVNISAAYTARMMMTDETIKDYLDKGKKNIGLRGMGPLLIDLIEKYGTVPYDSYQDPDQINYNALGRGLQHLAIISSQQKIGLNRYEQKAQDMMDQNMGYMPARTVFMLGAEYTPGEFARSICSPGEYVFMTSFTHHPFYHSFALETPDNKNNALFYNVPLNKMMATIEQTLRHGHPIFWEGDSSEPGFSFERGIATVPEKNITQNMRQQQFEQLYTTDDHAMELMGLAVTKKGDKYFVAKNSWGDHNPYQGYMYLSYNYVALKTIAIGYSSHSLKSASFFK